MGFWSKIKKGLKKAWKAVKSVVRQVVRIVVEVVSRVINLFDLLLGFLGWPPKKLRLHIFILSDDKGPLLSAADLEPSIQHLRQTLKDRFNVKLKSYSKSFVEIIEGAAPKEALEVSCSGAWLDEAGNLFLKTSLGPGVVHDLDLAQLTFEDNSAAEDAPPTRVQLGGNWLPIGFAADPAALLGFCRRPRA